MIKYYLHILYGVILTISLVNCQTSQPVIPNSNDIKPKLQGDYNVKFIGFDTNINNPENDRHTFYKIYINKIEEGRTTTGLESQEKIFKTKLDPNRHVLSVEKWILDKKEKKYKKLNNVHQPKPNFIYFNVPEDKIVIIKLESSHSRRAKYTVSFE